MKKQLRESVRLPKGWKTRVRSAVLEVISLAQYSLAYTRGWAGNSPNVRIRLKSCSVSDDSSTLIGNRP